MDNPLTPNKIQRLMHLAEDKSFNLSRRCLLNEEDLKRLTSHQAALNKTNYESSSGILDLERVEAFGESEIDNISLSKSTAFHPGEMTGRSTGADDVKPLAEFGPTRTFEELGRHSLALDSITSKMDKQTSEVYDVMRHSIATNYSFHSKRDLTADEASLVEREAPLPVQANTQTNFAESMTINNSNMSVGAYFKNRCPEFKRMLSKTDSPDRSQRPSITEVSTHAALEFSNIGKETNVYKMDQSLDSVPVKQPRNPVHNAPENRILNNLSIVVEKQNNCEVAAKQAPLSGRLTTKIENPSVKVDQKYGSSSNLNQVPLSQKVSTKPSPSQTNDFLKNLHSSALRLVTEDTDCSTAESLSISKIADYLGKQSNVSITDILKMHGSKRQMNKKQPLSELSMNMQERCATQEVHVVTLKDSKKCPTASSAGSVNTVISLDKLKIQDEKELPAVVVTQYSMHDMSNLEEEVKTKRMTRSKSPSSKSQSTLSTVHENFASFKSSESPLHSSKGEARTSHVPSPNVEYKELDKSVDWHEVLLQKRMKQEGLAKEQWADIVVTAANGFVGVGCPVTVTITTLIDSWLTAKFQFDSLPDDGKNLTVELPRFPILLSPGKSEQFTLYLTSSVEMSVRLPFTMLLKDASIDGDVEQSGNIEVNIKMPAIQALSCDGVNKLCFPPTPEKSCLTKSFVLMSDCPMDLQLDLSISEGDSMFSIKSVQEMKKSDVNKVLMDRQGSTEEQQPGKGKNKVMSKQLCRLSSGNAIKVVILFNAPKLSDLQLSDALASFTGILNVTLIGLKTILRRIELVGIVGSVNLKVDTSGDTIYLTHEPTNITVTNTGSIVGNWNVMFKHSPGKNHFPFKITPAKFDVRGGSSKTITMSYTGFEDTGTVETTLIFEEATSAAKTTIEIIGGAEKPKTFPIKTNYNTVTWVRPGRKEISLKNSTNKKVHIKCMVVGDGFSIDLPGESRGTYLLPFGPCELRNLPINFTPTSYMPQAATLHLVYDKTSDVTRKVKLYGCASGDAMRWTGLVTYGDTALVRAPGRAPVVLTLFNKARAPAFVYAQVNFNLQYRCLSDSARLSGGRHVVGSRERHAVCLSLDWARVERRARLAPASSALATVTVLTGAECTRRRILKVLRDESNGELDTSLLPEHLHGLAGQFEGEDRTIEEHIADFKETKASLNELIGGLQELTAQIDLPQDFADENTIIITDDTVVEHHTLCD